MSPPVTKRTNSMKYSVSRGLNKVCVSRGLKAQKYLAQGKRSGALGLACEHCARPVRAKV